MTSTAATYEVGVQSGAQFSDLAEWSREYAPPPSSVDAPPPPPPSVFSAQLMIRCANDQTCTFEKSRYGAQQEIPNSGGISYLLLEKTMANANYAFTVSIPGCEQSGMAASNEIKVNVTISSEVSETTPHFGDAAMRPPTFILRPMAPGASCTASHNWTAAAGGQKLIALEPTFDGAGLRHVLSEMPFNIDIEEFHGETVVTTHTRSIWISAAASARLSNNPIFEPNGGSDLSDNLLRPISVRPRASPRLWGGGGPNDPTALWDRRFAQQASPCPIFLTGVRLDLRPRYGRGRAVLGPDL